jgi:hypothetical protein
MSLYMYSLWIASATSLRKIYILESFRFMLGKPQRSTRKGFVKTQGQAKNIHLAANSEFIVNCLKL